MTESIRPHVDATRGLGEGTLSRELEKRIFELQLQLLERRQVPSWLVSALHFGRAAEAAPRDFSAATVAYMTDSSADTLSESLEQRVPPRTDFGPFRGRRK